MSHGTEQKTALCAETQGLLQGPLKHTRAAALALALVPVAAVSVIAVSDGRVSVGRHLRHRLQRYERQRPAGCGRAAGRRGHRHRRRRHVPRPAQPGPGDICPVATDSTGFYYFPLPPGTYDISVQIPNDTQPSPSNVGDDRYDSDGVSDDHGNSVAKVTLDSTNNVSSDDRLRVHDVRLHESGHRHARLLEEPSGGVAGPAESPSPA